MESSSIYAHIIPVTYHLTAQSIKDLVEAGNQDELTAAVREVPITENVIRSLPLTIWISIIRKSVTRSRVRRSQKQSVFCRNDGFLSL